jgi:predicted enzyme related to lactoylglutathione lyase
MFVEDVAAEQARLEAQGVEFIRKQGREYWGGIISTFLDPDGNYAQILEYRPG